MALGELEALGKLAASANEVTESFNGLNSSLGGETLGSIEGLGKAAKKTTSPMLAMAQKINEVISGIGGAIVNMTNFANQLDAMEQRHRLFTREWSMRFQQFEFQKESARFGTITSEIAKAKSNMEVAFQGEKLPLEIAKARLSIAQAGLHLQQARIQAARAELDYTNRLYQIESNLLSARKAAAEAPQNYIKALESLYEPFIKIDQAASTYTKTVGGSRASMKALRKETIDLGNERKIQAKYNTSVEELITLQTKYNTELGRSVKLTNDQKESLAALKQVYGDEKAIEFATKLSSFGYDMTRASSLAGKMFADASKRGIALDKYSKNLLTNIKMAQTLTFQRGVDGLREMAARASEINFNMNETAKAADKLSTLEGALQASSQLAVLGGNFAQFANPLAMFNEALNDAEGLQDRIINQFSGLASWDSNRGEIYMNGMDRVRLKEAAKAMGMDPNELINMTFEKARKDKLAPEIDRLGVSDDIKKLLSNVAQLDENGNGYITVNGKKTSMQEAAQMDPEELSKILRTQNNSDSENISEIAQSVLSIKDNVEGWTKSFGDTMSSSLEHTGIGDSFGEMVEREASTTSIMERLTGEYMRTSKAKIDFDKEMAIWNKKFAESTYNYEKQMAYIQMRNTHFAEYSAAYNYKTALFAEDEARIRLAQLDLAMRQARFREDVELPLNEAQLHLSYRQARRQDDIFEVQRAMLVMQAATSIGSIFGPWGAAIGGLIGGVGTLLASGSHLFRKLDSWEPFEKVFTGRNTDGFRKFNQPGSPAEYAYKNYDIDYLKGKYPTGGKVNNYGHSGLMIGPSHADGGIKIEVEGGEYVMPREETGIYYRELEAMRNRTFPTGNGGFNSMSVSNTNTNIFSDRYWGGGSGNVSSEPMKLDVTGTITLEISGSTANIDAQDLLKEPLLSQLVAAISRSQNSYNSYGVATETNLLSPFGIQ